METKKPYALFTTKSIYTQPSLRFEIFTGISVMQMQLEGYVRIHGFDGECQDEIRIKVYNAVYFLLHRIVTKLTNHDCIVLRKEQVLDVCSISQCDEFSIALANDDAGKIFGIVIDIPAYLLMRKMIHDKYNIYNGEDIDILLADYFASEIDLNFVKPSVLSHIVMQPLGINCASIRLADINSIIAGFDRFIEKEREDNRRKDIEMTLLDLAVSLSTKDIQFTDDVVICEDEEEIFIKHGECTLSRSGKKLPISIAITNKKKE